MIERTQRLPFRRRGDLRQATRIQHSDWSFLSSRTQATPPPPISDMNFASKLKSSTPAHSSPTTRTSVNSPPLLPPRSPVTWKDFLLHTPDKLDTVSVIAIILPPLFALFIFGCVGGWWWNYIRCKRKRALRSEESYAESISYPSSQLIPRTGMTTHSPHENVLGEANYDYFNHDHDSPSSNFFTPEGGKRKGSMYSRLSSASVSAPKRKTSSRHSTAYMSAIVADNPDYEYQVLAEGGGLVAPSPQISYVHPEPDYSSPQLSHEALLRLNSHTRTASDDPFPKSYLSMITEEEDSSLISAGKTRRRAASSSLNAFEHGTVGSYLGLDREDQPSYRHSIGPSISSNSLLTNNPPHRTGRSLSFSGPVREVPNSDYSTFIQERPVPSANISALMAPTFPSSAYSDQKLSLPPTAIPPRTHARVVPFVESFPYSIKPARPEHLNTDSILSPFVGERIRGILSGRGNTSEHPMNMDRHVTFRKSDLEDRPSRPIIVQSGQRESSSSSNSTELLSVHGDQRYSIYSSVDSLRDMPTYILDEDESHDQAQPQEDSSVDNIFESYLTSSSPRPRDAFIADPRSLPTLTNSSDMPSDAQYARSSAPVRSKWRAIYNDSDDLQDKIIPEEHETLCPVDVSLNQVRASDSKSHKLFSPKNVTKKNERTWNQARHTNLADDDFISLDIK